MYRVLFFEMGIPILYKKVQIFFLLILQKNGTKFMISLYAYIQVIPKIDTTNIFIIVIIYLLTKSPKKTKTT